MNSPDASVRNHVAARVAAALPAGARLCVGLSGGLDSVVLFDLLADCARGAGRGLSALHVHHGLSPNADAWATFCAALCARRGVPLAIEYVRVNRASSSGLEGAAREARYGAFAASGAPFIALAHHLDDQAETILLQLLRGTGLRGIAAMPELRALAGGGTRLFRPLLDVPRSRLAAHARAAGLEWIEDESNASTRHDRNYLRHEVAPLLDARFPGWREAASRFARHAAGADRLLEELARADGVPASADLPLALDPALAAGRGSAVGERRANALRAFLAANEVPMPTQARLAEMARQLYEARDDACVRLDHARVSLRRHRGEAWIEREGACAEAWRVAWHGEHEVDLGPGHGRVSFESAVGEGLAAEAFDEGWYFAPRAGGERIRLDPRRPTRTLKNLLQEHALPPWQREKLPLLFHGDRLAWVPGIGIAVEFACPAGRQGFRPCWRVAGKAAVC